MIAEITFLIVVIALALPGLVVSAFDRRNHSDPPHLATSRAQRSRDCGRLVGLDPPAS